MISAQSIHVLTNLPVMEDGRHPFVHCMMGCYQTAGDKCKLTVMLSAHQTMPMFDISRYVYISFAACEEAEEAREVVLRWLNDGMSNIAAQKLSNGDKIMEFCTRFAAVHLPHALKVTSSLGSTRNCDAWWFYSPEGFASQIVTHTKEHECTWHIYIKDTMSMFTIGMRIPVQSYKVYVEQAIQMFNGAGLVQFCTHFYEGTADRFYLLLKRAELLSGKK